MRKVGLSNVYESDDGSYTQLTDNGANGLTVITTDGTQLSFIYYSSLDEYRCTQIKDRNGNYITINYGAINNDTTLGRPTSVVDTLGRVINFNYDGQNYLTSITQSWRRDALGGAVTETHTWATFGYGTVTLQPNFPNLTVHATTGQAIPVLTSVGFTDGSYYEFQYESSWGVVKQIDYKGAGAHLISYTSYDIPSNSVAHTDSPRFTEQRVWGQYWNGDTNATPAANEESVTKYTVAGDGSWGKVISPDGTMHKELFGTVQGWQKGVTIGSEDWTADEAPAANGVKKKWTTLSYTLPAGNMGFEAPALGPGGYQYGPTGGSWSFVGGAGVSGNASGFTAGNPAAPEGSQVAFLQTTGTMSQTISDFRPNASYTVRFLAAQRGNYQSSWQNFEVFLDNVSLGVFLPSSTNYMEMTTSSFTTTAGAHTLKFVGLNSAGGDNTAFIDHVQVTAAGTVPLPLEINTHDDNGNQRRTAIQYGLYNLPAAVFEFGVSGGTATLLRQTNTSYNFSTGLLSRRLIGLVSVREIYDGTGALMARTTYDYDSNALYVPGAMPQHDSGITGARGLLTAVHRFDANHPYDTTKMVTATMGYDTAGSVVWKEDAAGHRTNISYADSYSDLNNTRNTRAFPTQMTDPDNFSSTMQYNYDMGVATHEQDPKGAAQAIVYDAVGRVERVTNQVNNAYIRWAHDLNQGHTKTFATLVAGQGEAYTNTIRDGVGQVILVVSSHAGSTGTYRTTRTEYDKMGRVSKQSNPTEITGAGYATGDDAGGYQWTLQSYDWKGRPTITTHPSHDGVSPSATTEFTYGGCGCAGGEATTVRDERGRRRRYTTDVLGRLAKVKEMNWLDSQGVYATTTYAYNARDQITSINQQGQTRSYVYDGHARISSQVTPEQGTKTYTYYADDMTHVVTDARGATQTFTYNGRHLPTHVAYGVPAGVGATANVTSGYDSAGNRTSMTDGLGSKTYVYNTLSQMTSETRTFTNVGSYTLAYEYNLASELTRVTNWWGAQVAYTHDTEGRTTGVNGLNSSNVPTYAGVGNYLSAMLYRANGGLKSATYGNGKTLALTYDGRLRLTGWNVPSTTGWTYNYSKFGEKSQRVTYAQNLYDTTLNRSFDYDEVGRLWEAHSGNEADAHVAEQPFPSNPNGPLSHSYRYDAYGNQTYRVGWGGSFSNYTNQFQSFTNNRRDGLVYDPSGNLTNDGAQYTYDATGQQVNGVYPAGWGGYANYSLQQAYDGDGLRARKTDNGVTTYALRSSVLGSQVVGELQQLNGVWTWTRGFVYLGGQLLALQVNNSVTWVHQDPVVKNQHLTNAQGTVTATVDLDSWGGETTRSWNSQQQTRKFTTYERDGSGNDQAMFRQYHPYWMRFDQPDPYAGSYDLSDPQSFNRYAYVQNDPVNFTDPTGLCTFNINITGLRGRALTDAQNEIRRIFRSGGHSVVFGQPTQADGGSANLRIVNFYSGEAAAHISRQGIGFANPMHRGIAGVTPPVGHNSYVNQQVIRTTTQQGRGRYQPGVSQGTMIGRVGAHEVIQHRFIGMGPEGQTSDITRSFADPSELSARLTARFNIGAYTAAILAALCAPRAQQAPPLHEELHTIGGGGGDVGPSYPIYFGGRGDMFDSFRWFDLWLASMRQGDARGSVGNIIYEEMF
jgi:RHS repeat-associated protein